MKTYSLLILALLLTGASQAKEPSRTIKTLRYTVVGTSVLAITSDWFVEHYFGKYKEAELSDDCVKYRTRTLWCENIRDASIWTAALSLTGSIVLEKLKKRPEEKEQGFLDKCHLKLYARKGVGMAMCYKM
jgi:hypothetical protein